MGKRWKEILLDQELKPMMGPCMISFAVPLFIPGVTLTLVAFNDETGFSKYSALHIVGMLFLIVASLLLIIGCVMTFACRSKVAPIREFGHSLVSTHVKSSDEKKPTHPRLETVDEKVKTSSHLEREPIPGASVGSSDTGGGVTNGILTKPDGAESELTSSYSNSPAKGLSGKPTKVKEKHVKRKSKEGSSLKSPSVSQNKEDILSSETNNLPGTNSEHNTEDDSKHSNNNAIIRQTFSNLRSEGDGEEHIGVDSKHGSNGYHGNRIIPHIRADDMMERRTANAWDSCEQHEENKLPPIDESHTSVNFFPPIRPREKRNNLVTHVVAAIDDVSDGEIDSYSNMEFDDDVDDDDDDDVTITVASRTCNTTSEGDAEGYEVDRFHNVWRGPSEQNSLDISSVVSQEEMSDSVSEMFDETEEMEAVHETRKGTAGRDIAIASGNDQSKAQSWLVQDSHL